MGQPDNALDGKAWQAFVHKYRPGDAVTGEVIGLGKRRGEIYGVFVSLPVEEQSKLTVKGLMPRATLPWDDIAHTYVPGQKVNVRIIRIKGDQGKGWIELEPTLSEWRNVLDGYQRRAISVVGGKVVEVSGDRVYVLLHDLALIGVVYRDGMFPCCQKDISRHLLKGQELKLQIERIGRKGVQWEIRLRLQRMSYEKFAAAFPRGATLDGTVHATDHDTLQILLDEGLMGTVPVATGESTPHIGAKVRVRLEALQPEEREIKLSLQDPAPRFGRVYWAEDKGIFTAKAYRPVVVAQTVQIAPSGWAVGLIKALYLSTTNGHLSCAVEDVCFLNRRAHIVLLCKPYPLKMLEHYQQSYRGELPQGYQQEIQRRLGLR